MTLVGFSAQNHGQQVARRGAREKVDDRRTPRDLWEPLNDLHRFTLDVAASAQNALCPRYFTIADDGLKQRWEGRVWCNPPYSDCAAWVRKARYESQWVESIVMLLPANRCEQAWWQYNVEPYRDNGGKLTTKFLAGRLRFDVPPDTYSDPRGNRAAIWLCPSNLAGTPCVSVRGVVGRAVV